MSVRPDVGLERLIHGLEQELLGAPDEEFLSGARDLGMNPEMKGSAAFIGVKYTFPKRASEIFDLEELRRFYVAHAESVRKPRKTRSFLPKVGRKDRDDDEK